MKKPNNKNLKLTKILRKSFTELFTFWRPISLVVGVYAVLYVVIILGLNILPSAQDLQDQVTGYIGESAGSFARSLVLITVSITNNSQSDATSLLQFLLFLIASLALIWTLRKLQLLKKISITEAYYSGTATLIPVTLVSIMLILCIIPVGLGGIILATASQSGGGAEIIVASLFTGLCLFVTAYLFAVYWPAFYIASLPGTKPIFAMRKSAEITKKLRIKLLIKIILILISLFVIFFAVLIPIALLVPYIVPVSAFALLFFYFAFMHVFLYTTYRGLIDES